MIVRSLRGFGDLDLATGMARILEALRAAIADGRAWATKAEALNTSGAYLIWSVASDQDILDARSAFNSMEAGANRLDADRRDVLAGTLAPEKWFASIQTLIQGVQDGVKIIDDSYWSIVRNAATTTQGIWDSTVKFVQNPGSIIPTALDLMPTWAKWTVGIAAAGAGVYALSTFVRLGELFRRR